MPTADAGRTRRSTPPPKAPGGCRRQENRVAGSLSASQKAPGRAGARAEHAKETNDGGRGEGRPDRRAARGSPNNS